ncbi:putative WRKY transcription factor [Melia azedarach]|uniref:WRKY transcription factor n=1 Tax=Melia azedarach TaxID=155640 RepID=A0ACC1Z356_MELAZ|nr:putative WRKY transcription factor [Melia azedarach]
MVSSREDVVDKVASDKLQDGPIAESVSETHALQSDQQVGTPPRILNKEPMAPPDTGHSMPTDQQRSISFITSEKASETTDIVHASQTGQEGSNPMIMREKVSEDGYNWRKYGQKLVRGNEFVRSYYKCTNSSCPAKKQLDCTHDGQIADTIYFGEHCHPKLPNLPLAVGFVVSIVEEKPDDSSSSIAKVSDGVKGSPLQSNKIKDEVDNGDRPGSKRRKKDNYNTSATIVERPSGEQRVVVQTLSEVDFVNDGYRWRKYGQKLVKGNPNPRNYYRCSSSGCAAKKHVERASHDPKLVITTYEGRHDHEMPPSRTVTHNVSGTNSNKTGHNGESATKLEENDHTCPDTAVHSSSDLPSKSSEEQNSQPGTIEGSDMGQDTVVHVSSCHKGGANDKSNCESETKSEQNGTVCRETNFSEQEQTPKTEAVQS